MLFQTDAVQAVGKVAVDVREQNIDLMSITGHKLYGPKGAGALYVRGTTPRVKVAPCWMAGDMSGECGRGR